MNHLLNVPSPLVAADVSWNRFAEDALLLQASAGVARIKLGPNFAGGDTSPTGLANDATVYTATVIVDGATEAVSIVGSAAQTIASLVTELNADLSAAVTFEGDEIVITSTTTGPLSSVFVSDTGANFLFASLRGDTDPLSVSTEHYGVSNYNATRGWFAIAGSTNRVGESIRGNNRYLRWDKLPDFEGTQAYISDIVDRFLAATVANTNQPWENAAAGISIVGATIPTLLDDSQLSRATVYQLQLNVNGAGNVTVFVDLNENQTQGASFEQLMAAVEAGLANARQSDGSPLPVAVEWRQGYDVNNPTEMQFVVKTSNTLFSATATGAVLQGATSSLVITDGLANGLVAAITATAAWTGAIDTAAGGFAVVNFNRVNAAAVTPATVPAVATGNYDITVAADGGAATDYVIAVTVADDMATIAGTIATATGLTVTATGNKFVLTSTTANHLSDVVVTIPTVTPANPDLFQAIAAALDVVDPRGDTDVSTWHEDGFATPGVNGATNLTFPKTYNGVVYNNWMEVLDTAPIGGRVGSGQYIFGPTGFGPLFTSQSAAVFEKENRPQARGQCVDRTVYWDGAAWRYFVDGDASRLIADDTSAGTNNPPSTRSHL